MIEIQISWDAETETWRVRCLRDGAPMGDTWQAWSDTGMCAYDKARRFALALGARNAPITWMHKLAENGSYVRNTPELPSLRNAVTKVEDVGL